MRTWGSPSAVPCSVESYESSPSRCVVRSDPSGLRMSLIHLTATGLPRRVSNDGPGTEPVCRIGRPTASRTPVSYRWPTCPYPQEGV